MTVMSSPIAAEKSIPAVAVCQTSGNASNRPNSAPSTPMNTASKSTKPTSLRSPNPSAISTANSRLLSSMAVSWALVTPKTTTAATITIKKLEKARSAAASPLIAGRTSRHVSTSSPCTRCANSAESAATCCGSAKATDTSATPCRPVSFSTSASVAWQMVSSIVRLPVDAIPTIRNIAYSISPSARVSVNSKSSPNSTSKRSTRALPTTTAPSSSACK